MYEQNGSLGNGHGTATLTSAAELADLRERVSQLERALSSRVVIEQAKGVLAERLEIGVEQAFAQLRRAARSDRLSIHVLAARVVDSCLPRSSTSDDLPPELARRTTRDDSIPVARPLR